MSGEAGAALDSEHYGIFVGSGVNVSVEPPPGDDGSAIGRYFEEKSQPFRDWLARARPLIDALFVRLIAKGVPIVALAQKYEEIDGTIIGKNEEQNAPHFRRYHRGGPLMVRLNGGGRMPDHGSLQLHFLVSRRVKRSEIDPIIAKVMAVLQQTR